MSESNASTATLQPCGIPCILRLYVEDMNDDLVMTREFSSFDELNAFIAANPDLDGLAGANNVSPILGVVEVVNGKPCRTPLGWTEDDGLGFCWSPFGSAEQEQVLSSYDEGVMRRARRVFSALSERDQADLRSNEPSEKSQLIFKIAHTLTRKHYNVIFAQSNDLVGSWADEHGPESFDSEIVLDDCYDFPIPVPQELCYSQAFCKFTALSGLDFDGSLSAKLKEFEQRHAHDSKEEFAKAYTAFSRANSTIGSLKILLAWAESLPERP